MRIKLFFVFCLFLLIYSVTISSCKKDSFITNADAKLSTSVDSLTYDTVFTTVGSITKSFKINNNNKEKLRLSTIKLMGGNSSSFTININGINAAQANNVDINANDSIYVFVTVKIDQNTNNLPFIITDTVEIIYNGVIKKVSLQAYGQNAVFLKGQTITSNTTWTNNLPYVILDSLKIAEGKRLIINNGCKIYFHANAPMLVEGTLVTNGTSANPIIFAGDRLDEGYKDYPAAWPGIYFYETSKSNVLKYTTIKNSYQAIVAIFPATNTVPKVTLHQCIVDNAYDIGIASIASSIAADNSLISNCGKNISIQYGGDYTFTNCTVATFGNYYIEHKKPVLSLDNYNSITNDVNDLSANFINCIFWGDYGSVKDEVVTDKKSGGIFGVNFTNCLYKATNIPTDINFSPTCILNQSPKFDSIDAGYRHHFDFHTNSNSSPVIGVGNTSPAFNYDLDGNPRKTLGLIDLGCYQKQ